MHTILLLLADLQLYTHRLFKFTIDITGLLRELRIIAKHNLVELSFLEDVENLRGSSRLGEVHVDWDYLMPSWGESPLTKLLPD